MFGSDRIFGQDEVRGGRSQPESKESRVAT
jgi:hypothetical protein